MTNNGSQHLSALTLDEVTAPHVNLTPAKYPGDLYMYVGHHLWARLEAMRQSMSQRAIASGEQCIELVMELKSGINNTTAKTSIRKSIVDDMARYRNKYRQIIKRAAPLFWLRIDDDKHKRKIVKR